MNDDLFESQPALFKFIFKVGSVNLSSVKVQVFLFTPHHDVVHRFFITRTEGNQHKLLFESDLVKETL